MFLNEEFANMKYFFTFYLHNMLLFTHSILETMLLHYIKNTLEKTLDFQIFVTNFTIHSIM
jgi:hypothetical protein